MTESTSYLDMNKKLCHPSETKKLHDLYPCFRNFKPSRARDRSIYRSLLQPQKKSPKESQPIHCLLLTSTHKKKIFHAFKQIFFPPRPGVELTHYQIFYCHPQRAPSPHACAIPAAALAPAAAARRRSPPLPSPLTPTWSAVSPTKSRALFLSSHSPKS